jgi:hypothetical protein
MELPQFYTIVMTLPIEEVHRVTTARLLDMLNSLSYLVPMPCVESTRFARYGARPAPDVIIESACIQYLGIIGEIIHNRSHCHFNLDLMEKAVLDS